MTKAKPKPKPEPTINLTLDEFDKLGDISAAFGDLAAIIEPGTGSTSNQRGVGVLQNLVCDQLDELWSDVSEREKFHEKQDAATE